MTKQRNCLTDEEHETLVDVGDAFWHALGQLAAEHIAKMPADLEALTADHLQDLCSIYGSEYSELLPAARRKEKAK